jgi:hypothetical protein
MVEWPIVDKQVVLVPYRHKLKEMHLYNTQRGKFFDGRNVPEERVFRRTAQDTLDRQFKDRFMRPAGGSNTNLLQMTADAPRSLAANRMLLANRLGPTPSEVFGDMTYAGGSILQGLQKKAHR